MEQNITYKFLFLFLFLYGICVSLKGFDLNTDWYKLKGNWTIENDSLYVKNVAEEISIQSYIIKKNLVTESIWTELSVDVFFDTTKETAGGFILNYQDSSNFAICRLVRSNNSSSFELGWWRYGYYRPYLQIDLKNELSLDKCYNISIKPNTEKTEWRPWIITVIEVKTGKLFLKQGVENEMPFFGRGIVGLYSSINKDICFKNFQIRNQSETNKLLKLTSIFSGGMVLQRNKNIPMWGKAKPTTKVFVKIGEDNYETVSDSSGSWKITLNQMIASQSIEILIHSLTDTIKIENVAVGEVWLASGQSNMGMKVWQSDIDTLAKKKPDNDNIRFFIQPQWPSEEPLFDSGGHWEQAKYSNVQNWSAIAYGFALNLQEKLNIPVGIIASYWGGTSVQSWFPKEVLKDSKETSAILTEYHKALAALENNQEIRDVYYRNIPGQVHTPGYLFNGMISPFVPYCIKGVIWYQGESNTLDPRQYTTLFSMLINHWRKIWNNLNLYFAYVQLAAYDGKESGSDIENAWPLLRESQRIILQKEKNTGMAVAIDVGDSLNIHPFQKQPIAERLSRLALHDVYNLHGVVRSGPMYKSVVFKGDTAFISFSETNCGLKVMKSNEVNGFLIAGKDKKFINAKAIILNNNTVKVYSPVVTNPKAVRYAWSNYPGAANLYNSVGLPTSPFRTDNWNKE